MSNLDNLDIIYNKAINNDQKIDKNEFEILKKEILNDSKKYYLTKKQNIWLGLNKEWQYGGKENSTAENKSTVNLGIKF